MTIPFSIIMDALSGYNVSSHIESESVAFTVVSIFPARERKLCRDHLYVGKLSEILSAQWRDTDICCIAVRDRIQDVQETEESMRSIAVLNRNCDVIDVFTLIQSKFFDIMSWHEHMNECIIHNRPLQELLNLSESIIGNYITISDSSLGLLAYTSGLEVDCPITNALVKNGYHSDESIAAFRKYRMPESWDNQHDVYVNYNNHISPYPNVCRVIHYNNTYYAHVVMICNSFEPTQGVVDLFRMLVDRIMVYFERIWHDKGLFIHAYDSLLISLIDDSDISIDIIHDRAQHSGLPISGCFRFIKIYTEDKSSAMLQRMGQDIVDLLQTSRVTLYGDSLIALVVQPDEDTDVLESARQELDRIMEAFSARCGISTVFTNLTDLHIAYEQADIALRCGDNPNMFPFSINAQSGPARIHSFENCYPSHLVSGMDANARLARRTKASASLEKLYAYDLKHGTNNLELLFVYLNNERRATVVANLLHMHRNNVIYRINRIEEIIDMDLNDSSVRFRLQLAYEIFSLGEYQYQNRNNMLPEPSQPVNRQRNSVP